MRSDMAETLVRTGPGTAMGNVMRRYWVPVLLESEIPEPDCPPVRIKILGESLLAFRDSNGRPGLIDEFCAHRATSLFFGRNEEGGIRCSYHGWKYDVNGQCVDLPSEPATAARISIKAYPCVERGGVVWAYMGPPEHKPGIPELEWCMLPGAHRFVSKRWQESNYLQGMEGGIDTTHVSFVHRYELDKDRHASQAVSKKYIKADPNVMFTVREAPFGLTIFGRRNGEPDSYYWRVTQWIFPWFTLIPPTGPHPIGAHAWIPIDDENCWVWNISYYVDRPFTDDERSEMAAGSGIHAAMLPGTFRPVANKSNDYCVDRQAQKERGSYSGVAGFAMQDASLQEAMGPIQDRTRERLVQTDKAIVLARRKLHAAAVGIDKEDCELPALDPSTHRVRSASVLLGKAQDVERWADDSLLADERNPVFAL